MEIILYRGDKRENGSLAEMYRSVGIYSKQINGGNPAYVDRHGLMESIRAHVKPLITVEKVFQQKSKFISFTSNYERAKYFASDGKTDLLIPCKEYYERRYIFTLEISPNKLEDFKNGIYRYEYLCNRQLTRSNSIDPFDINVMKMVPCDFCQNNKNFHSILLIDVCKYLNQNKDNVKFQNAIKSAERDSEWLVIPTDYSIELRGDRSNIPVADFWRAEHFILKHENMKDPYEDAIKGVIYNDY